MEAFTSGPKFGSRFMPFCSTHCLILPSHSIFTPILQEGQKCVLACLAVHVEHQSPITSFSLHPKYALLLCSFSAAHGLIRYSAAGASCSARMNTGTSTNGTALPPQLTTCGGNKQLTPYRYLPSADALVLLTADGASQQV